MAPIRGTRILKDDTDWMEENLAGKQLVKKHKEISHTETGMFFQQRTVKVSKLIQHLKLKRCKGNSKQKESIEIFLSTFNV